MKQIITNAAQVAVLRLIDETFKTGGGPISIGATVIEASKGPVGAVTPVTWSTWKQVFGKPLQNGVGTKMEGLRHLADAAKECNYVNVVRVVASDAKYPYLEVTRITDKGNWVADIDYALNDVVTITDQSRLICITAHTSTAPEPTGADTNWAVYTTPVATDEEAYGIALTLGTGLMMQIWPVDGDPSVNRKFEITDVDDATKRFTIKFYDTDESGNEYLMEYYTVGIDPNDRDDMGRTAFIQTVLEERSDIFRCNWDTSLAWTDIADTLSEFSAKT